MASELSQTSTSTPQTAAYTSNADGNLLVLLIAALYCLFTFISTTQIIVWPWVALWQAALMLPMGWLLWQVWHKPLSRFQLGNGFDWLAGLAIAAVVVNALAATFAQQAVWYSIGLLGAISALYGLVGWFTPPRVIWLLKAQGYLTIAFIVSSLGQWGWRIYRPEMQRLAALRAYGLEQSFDLTVLGLRNWYPLGHQNYVAGYLVLGLPLLVGLAIHDKTRQRLLWIVGILLGLLNLYTTNSRGGTLALLSLIVPLLVGIVRSRHLSRRVWLPLSLTSAALVGLFLFTNPRVKSSLIALSRGGTGAVGYRIITNVIGWRMGVDHPLSGTGLGSVPLVFQRYRPFWAGRAAEQHYQLHSTPAQLWGEMGLWGIVLPVAGILLLGIALWRRQQWDTAEARSPAILQWSLVSALWGYGVLSLTDYQLDVIAISGILILYLAVLLYSLRPPASDSRFVERPKLRRGLALGGVGLLLALILWLIPLHRAWASSAKGFLALEKGNIPAFIAALEQSHTLAPQEPYYPQILGWVLGDLSYQVEDTETASALRDDAVKWFQTANQISPFQEFGHSNLGWLLLPKDPAAAIAEFAQSAQLLPAKQGVFYGLGVSLYQNGQPNLAAEAIALEMLRHPAVMTHLPLNQQELNALLPAISDRVNAISADILRDRPMPHLSQVQGTLHWWQGDLAAAARDFQSLPDDSISQAVLATAQGKTPDLAVLPDLPGKFALQAWQTPGDRRQLLETAWLADSDTEDLPQLTALQPSEEEILALLNAMNAAETFDQWLKELAPYSRLRNERLGFGVLMRHDDGPSPFDFYFRWENLAMMRFFEPMLPSPQRVPGLEESLQPHRDALLQQLPPREGQ